MFLKKYDFAGKGIVKRTPKDMKCDTASLRPLIILDHISTPPQLAGVKVHWDSFETGDDEYSIPELVNKNAKEIKKEYLSFVYKLGKCKIRGVQIQERLKISGDFSYWWLTLIAEKSGKRMPEIYDVFRIREVEKLFFREKCDGIILLSGNQKLHEVLSAWCRKQDQFYQWGGKPQSSRIRVKDIAASVKDGVPYILKAFKHLFQLLYERRVFVFSKPNCAKDKCMENTINVVSYFPNIDIQKAKQGIFWSNYWTELHTLTDKKQIHINWIFNFEPNSQCESPSEARKISKTFSNHNSGQTFSFIEQWFSFSALLETLWLYVKIRMKAPSYKKAKEFFVLPESGINFSSFFEQCWEESMSGWWALNNCLYYVLYKRVARELAEQGPMLYLQENNSWERGLVQAWQGKSIMPIIGCQHSTICELNLRYFNDYRVYQEKFLPIPTLMAVNGENSFQLMKEWGYPERALCKVEALRYLYINKTHKIVKSDKEKNKYTLLVLTDIIPESSNFIIRILADALKQDGWTIPELVLVKPHPFCPVDNALKEYVSDLSVNIKITNQPLADLWKEADWVFCANHTTCGIEAAIIGLPVIVALNPNSMNESPLYGINGVKFAAKATDLSNAMSEEQKSQVPQDYFYLDKDLRKWQSILYNCIFNSCKA